MTGLINFTCHPHILKFSESLLPIALVLSLAGNTVIAQTAPSFGAASTFAILGAATVTNTGLTTVSGNVGVSPGTAITGFVEGPGKVINGSIYAATGIADITIPALAHAAAMQVYTTLAGETSANTVFYTPATDIGGLTLEPGIYSFPSSAFITGTLTLDDTGNPNAVFIFQIGSSLVTASSAKVVMKSGGQDPNVFWQVGSSATIGTYSDFRGNIIALASITMTTGATSDGKLFAMTGAVTLDTDKDGLVIDSDGDGVPDNLDDYPLDATMSFNNYSNAASGSATAGTAVAFEDSWPKKADFDMNDLVMVSSYNIITNAQNIVVKVVGNFSLTATGGSNKNAYGVEFPIPAADLDSLQGGTQEAGQTKAVVMLFSDMRAEVPHWNTDPGTDTSAVKKYTISFRVKNGPLLSVFGTDYNQFIFNYVGTSRREIHLPGNKPTTLADLSILGTFDDGSNPAAGIYYVSRDGLPFSLKFPLGYFDYPTEGTMITSAYLHFADWANSGGLLYTDWYSNLSTGYRNDAYIYHK